MRRDTPTWRRKMKLKWVNRYPHLSCPFHDELVWMVWVGSCYWLCSECRQIYVTDFRVGIL